jgi:hypothetical protein
MMGIEIKVGGTYKSGKGEIVDIEQETDSGNFIGLNEYGNHKTYNSNGIWVFFGGNESEWDLIEPYYGSVLDVNKHVNAKFLLEFAQLAQLRPDPWEEFEYSSTDCPRWEQLTKFDPISLTGYKFRRKQPLITVNGFEVEAPVKNWDSYEHGDSYFYVELTENNYYEVNSFLDDDIDNLVMQRGLVHFSKEGAIAHAKAMLGIDPEED